MIARSTFSLPPTLLLTQAKQPHKRASGVLRSFLFFPPLLIPPPLAALQADSDLCSLVSFWTQALPPFSPPSACRSPPADGALASRYFRKEFIRPRRHL